MSVSSSTPDRRPGRDTIVWQVCKVNKQKLIVEEVEQFTDISIPELVDGTFAPILQYHRIHTKV